MDHNYDNMIPTIQYFVERKNMPGWNLNETIIPFNDLTYLVDGEADYIVNGEKVKLRQGDVIYIPVGSSRKACTNPQNPIHCYAFNFIYKYLDDAQMELPFPQKFSIKSDSELLSLYRQFNNLWLEKETGYMLKARGMFMVILHRLIKLLSNCNVVQWGDPNVEKIKRYILSHFTDKIYVKELADMVSLHPVYLSTRFKEVTGYTIKEFINRIRINKAYDLLATNGYSITETANICGFEDIFYFSKLFKKLTGLPPSVILKTNLL